MRSFQKQSTTIVLDCRDGLDSETFHNDIFFMTITAAVTKIPLYYKKMCFLKIIVKSLKGYTFCSANIYIRQEESKQSRRKRLLTTKDDRTRTLDGQEEKNSSVANCFWKGVKRESFIWDMQVYVS